MWVREVAKSAGYGRVKNWGVQGGWKVRGALRNQVLQIMVDRIGIMEGKKSTSQN